MNPFKRTRPTAAAEVNPGYDIATGEPLYTQDIGTLIENPPNLLLAPMSHVINPDFIGSPGGVDVPNFQQFQSGETNAEPDNPAATQGEGRAPGWQWAHFPHVQQFNPMIESNTYMQDGGGFHAFSERVQRSPIWPEGYEHYTQQVNQKHVWPEVAVVNQPEIPAFVEFVPPIR